MFTVDGCVIIPYPPPRGNFAESFNIKVPEDFIERDINFDENGECRDNDTLHVLWHFIYKNRLLDKEIKDLDGEEIVLSPLNFSITYIKRNKNEYLIIYLLIK